MKIKPIILFLIFSISSLQIIAQYDGILDYRREESPAISWNGINLFDARSQALADISLLSSKPFSQIQNPAFALDRENHSIGLSANITGIQAFQYWGLNQGVFTSQLPLSKKTINPGAVSFQFVLNKFNLTCGYRVGDFYTFPDFDNSQEYGTDIRYSLSGEFSGKDNLFFFSGAFELSEKLNIGIGLEYLSGERNVNIYELESNFFWDVNSSRNVLKDLTTSRIEIHRQQFVRLTLGAVYQLSKKLNIGAYIKIPFEGTADREVSTRFENDFKSLNVEISGDFSDSANLPVLLSMGGVIQIPLFKSEFTLAFETDYRIWENYHYFFFSEEIQRDMRNTLSFKLGIEYPFFMGDIQEYFRFGFKIEQQPVKSPIVNLNALSFGTGIQLGDFNIDLSFILYFTTSLDYNQKHFIANTTVSLSF